MNPVPNEQITTNVSVYNYAATLLVNEGKTSSEVIDTLIQQGYDKDNAASIVSTLEQQITDAKTERAKKDMLYGGLWCVGGTVATLANIGFIFWGAIVFGGVQFFRGLINYSKSS